MEVEFDADFVASDEESSSALVQRISKRKLQSNLNEGEGNETAKPETETGRNASIISNIEGVIMEVQNDEEKFGGEEFKAAKQEMTENVRLTTVEEYVGHENREFNIACSLSLGPSNEPAVVMAMTADSTHSKAAPLQPSVYYADEQGFETNVILNRGSECIDSKSKETEFVMSEMVLEAMTDMEKNQKCPTAEGNWKSNYMDSETSTEAYINQSFVTGKFNHIEKTENGQGAFLDTRTFSVIGSIATGRNRELTTNEALEKTENAGVKEHQHGNSASEIILQNSQDRYVRAQDEQQLKEHWTRTFEKSALEGKVEDIVNILKEQQSHDLICPVCNSYITKRIILRKRKRISLDSGDRLHKEAKDAVQGAVSEGEPEITEDHNVQPEIPNENDEETEAYGCLACLSIIFRRVPVKEIMSGKITKKQPTVPPSSCKPTIDDQTGHAESKFEVPNESVPGQESDMHGQHLDTIAESKYSENLHQHQNDMKVTGDQLTEMPFNSSAAAIQGQSNKKDYFHSVIWASIPAFWSIWPSKKSTSDQQLKEPLLANIKDKETIDKVPVASQDDQKMKIISETRVPEFSEKIKVDDSVSQSPEISPDSGKIMTSNTPAVATVIDIKPTDDPQPSNTDTADYKPEEAPSTDVPDLNEVPDWDILKSTVYGGLTVSISSLGVVSSAAGGEAKTLTVIAIGLSNLVAGLFLIFNNILNLDHSEFIETVGHRFWFNGFVAILSYLIFGSLAPITYSFSFQKNDDRVYKFLATSLVSLLSIILLASGKARVTKKSYIRIVILYIVTGFWASFIGFFAGEYIKKLLEKWGFTTD